MWRSLAALCLLGLPFAAAEGGFDGGPVETAITMEALSRGLAVEPHLGNVVPCGVLLRPEQRAGLVAGLAASARVLAFAQAERQSRYALNNKKIIARQDGSGWRIDGQKSLVLHGHSADILLVSARVSGNERDREGIGLFQVDAQGSGVSWRGYPTQDGLRAAEITFESAPAEALGMPGSALPAMGRVEDEALAALCA